MDSTALTPMQALPALDDLANAAQYVNQCAAQLRENGAKIVSDLERIEQDLISEANQITTEAKTRAAALFERAAQVRAMVSFHTGVGVALAVPEQKAA